MPEDTTPSAAPPTPIVAPDGTVRTGLCACGCGKRTTVASVTHAIKGRFKGFPNRYVHGHQARIYASATERRERANERWRGDPEAKARSAARLRAYRKGHPEKFAGYERSRYAKHKDKRNAGSRRWYERNRERQRRKTFEGKWSDRGIACTAQDYMHLLDAQRGRCAICGGTNFGKRLAVDHSHQTGVVRGLLCTRCNVGLGNLDDRASRLRLLVLYLSTPPIPGGGLVPRHPAKPGKRRGRIPRRSHKGLWYAAQKCRYGLDPEQVDALLGIAGGSCMACHAPSDNLKTDHDHRTNRVRGLLCHQCNATLGQFRDSQALLHRAVGYLRGYMTFMAPRPKHPEQTLLWTQIERR